MDPHSSSDRIAPRRTRARRRTAIALAVLLAGAAAFGVFHQRSGAQRPAPASAPPASITVAVVTPQTVTFDRAIAATGNVGARDELIIGSDAAGVRLTHVLVEAGSVVRKGDLLAQGDDTQVRAQLAQQDALIRQAEIDLAHAKANLQRAERLRDAGFYSTEALETRQTAVNAAVAKFDLSRAQRRELEVRLGYTRIVAPAAGVISRKAATVGLVVQPGLELFRLIRDGELEWRAEVPAYALANIAQGTRARVHLDGGRTLDASVRLVAPTVDESTRNGLVHVALPKDTPLKAGAHVRGELLLGAAQALAVPEAAVLTRDGATFVYVVGNDGLARLTRVETGARQRGLVEIRAGVDANARVVTTGAGFVKDGDLVRIAAADGPGVARAGDRR